MDDLEQLTSDLYETYQTQVRPSFDTTNLPAYFGGITLSNTTIHSVDVCAILSFVNPNFSNRY